MRATQSGPLVVPVLMEHALQASGVDVALLKAALVELSG